MKKIEEVRTTFLSKPVTKQLCNPNILVSVFATPGGLLTLQRKEKMKRKPVENYLNLSSTVLRKGDIFIQEFPHSLIFIFFLYHDVTINSLAD